MMDSSKRAVEAYWRSRMIDGVTSDEDKVAAVYKLEEICELLRSSDVSIVKEITEYVLKRLDHKSPIVKQKALRFIKYSMGKSGVEFKREMQRHSISIRQLLHYKGQLDPLKGDALNKAVRETAQEALSAVFSSEESKPSASNDLDRRIQGFGNRNFENSTDDRKSFLSEVVELGAASIKQGLNTITAAHMQMRHDIGSYKSPNLRKSLTTDRGNTDGYKRDDHARGSWNSSGFSNNISGGNWSQDAIKTEVTNEESEPSLVGEKSREERLLETIVTSGGVRLQPTRDALQVFLVEATKLDAVALANALDSKLQAHSWQVRLKALCVLEAILRKKDDASISVIASYYSENKDAVVKCSEAPQTSLREKANKVLNILNGDQPSRSSVVGQKLQNVKVNTASVEMPYLIDTGDPIDFTGESEGQNQIDQTFGDLAVPSIPSVDDLFGDNTLATAGISDSKNEDDPFSDVSFHASNDSENTDNLFSGLIVDNLPKNESSADLLDILSYTVEPRTKESSTHKSNLEDLMGDLSVNDKASSLGFPLPNNTMSSGLDPQQINLFPFGMQYSNPSNILLDPSFASQPLNYNSMSNLIAQQQQLLASMVNGQHLGSFSNQVNPGPNFMNDNSSGGIYPSPLPHIFHPTQGPRSSQGTVDKSSKKEETKAFDFISDHLTTARKSKTLI